MIFITGIAGFIGSNLANELHERGYEVTGCDNLQFGYRDNLNSEIKWIEKGFEELDPDALKRHTTLVHCATANIIYAQDNHIETFATNALKSIYLIKKFSGKIIYTSTASVYGNSERFPIKEDFPKKVTNAYDQSKLITELYLQLRGNYTTLRLSNVYGKNQRPDNPYAGVVARFIEKIIDNKPVEIIGDGLATRDFTYYKDTINAIIKAIDLPALDTEINISSGVETSVINLAYRLFEILDKEVYMTFIKKRQIDGIDRRWADISRAKELLDWQPEYNLIKGLKDTLYELSLLPQAEAR